MENILKRDEYKFLREDERLGKNIAYLTVAGSIAYGTNVETSDVDIRTNCEFHARGVVVMFVDGVAVGDSIENPEIEELYNAIVKKFL